VVDFVIEVEIGIVEVIVIDFEVIEFEIAKISLIVNIKIKN